MQNQIGKENEFQNKDFFTILISKSKLYLYERNYILTSRSNISYLYAAVLHTIYFFQIYVLFSHPTYNQAVTKDSDMYFLVQKGILLLTKFNVETQTDTNEMNIIVLCVLQIVITLAYLIPVKSISLNNIISKYLIQLFSIIGFVPSVFISVDNIFNSKSIYLSLFTVFITFINRLAYVTMHFEFSIQGQSQNILIRNSSSTSLQITTFLFIIIFLLCKFILYPMSLIVFFIINILYCLFQVKNYCIGFNYHNESITKLMGILEIMKISICLCYVIVIATEITLVKNNILTFIGAFFFFFANFFLIFKKYATKSIVIDSQDDNQTKKMIFIMWYFTCFRNRAEKKNQLYLSSLLKNHSSECSNLNCCCQKRSQIYDPSSNTFGSPQSQPHQDLVYIKHFFLKNLTDTYKSFPKSNQVLFLLAFYSLEILNFIPQTIQLIKQLKKKSLKNNLTFSEDYVLYCLGERCYEKIKEINNLKGNLNLEKVRAFDLKILNLKETIKFSVDTFSSLWKTICSQRYNQKNLVEICKVALQVMFKIQESYKEIKAINSVSTELKELMIFYSKSVAHDIHLLSEIRKQIKLDSQKVMLSNLTEVKEINIFSPNTITLVTSQISNIRWASKNCYSIFGYSSRQEFLKLKINDLMPKYFGQNHDSYIQKWLETGHSSKLNKCSYLWGSTKDGYCFSIGFYVKIIPLQKQQDFAFFAAIQKIDIENEIICDQQGQILGSGKAFVSTIKCSQQTLQQYKPNIQILLPSTFQFFIEAFFPQKKSLNQLLIETKSEGYFPKHLQNFIKEFHKEKQAFMNKNGRKSNLKELYSNFIKQKMQQITVNMGGQYISLIFTVHQLNIMKNTSKKIIVLKLVGVKKNNVEKYYSQLEKMITRIENLSKQRKNQKNLKALKSDNSQKKDYFRFFLNPKRVKKILQQQDQQRQSEQHLTFDRLKPLREKQRQKIQFSRSISSNLPSQQKVIDHRKKLALGAQYQIKGERAKYNIFKLKKALFQEGVFSRYTYNMLLGKVNDFESLQNLGKTLQKPEQQANLATNLQQQVGSDDQLTSKDQTMKQRNENDDKMPNDKQTFNSATSSAAFISMTNSIKMFKIKMRSLNTPKLLYWLNVGLILIILLLTGFQIWLWIEETKETQIGEIYFSQGIKSSWVIDSLMMGKLMTQKLVHLQEFRGEFSLEDYEKSKTDLKKMRSIYVDRMQDILSVQLLDYASLQKQDPQIMRYLFLQIPLNETQQKGSDIVYLQALEFMMREQDFSKLDYNVINPIQIQNLRQRHKHIYQKNIYYEKLQTIDQNLFIAGLVAIVAAFIVTIPIVYKIESKVEQIMYLISKISFNQRKRYYLQFNILSQQLKKLNQTQSWAEIENLQQAQLYQNQLKMSTSFQNEKDTQKFPLLNKNQHKTVKVKFYETIFFKISIIYVVYLMVCISKFVYIRIIFDHFVDENNVYTRIMEEKLKLTENSLNFNQFATRNESYKISKSQIVNEIYKSYHLSDKMSSNYADFLLNATTGNICQIIKYKIQQINDSNSFMNFFKFKSQEQLKECQDLHNKSLTKGLFGTLDYIEQKIIYLISRPKEERIDYLKSMKSIQIQKSLYYSNMMVYLIQRQIKFEVQRKKEQLIFEMNAWLIVVGVILFLFAVAWIFIYLNIAERASYINAFLLLIPYEVLSENPYIKLYIKNQFDYKASVS